MSQILEKLNSIMDQIQAIMESDPRAHIPPSDELLELLRRANIYFAHMDDENRDYFQYVNHAIEEETEWNV